MNVEVCENIIKAFRDIQIGHLFLSDANHFLVKVSDAQAFCLDRNSLIEFQPASKAIHYLNARIVAGWPA